MARGLKFRIKVVGDCTIRIAKTKALISFVVTAKLICVFVFAYAKIRFSHDAAHIMAELENIPIMPAHSRTIICLYYKDITSTLL